MHKISVIIPVHNSQPYIRQCLDSTLAQTHNNIEVICVENGSSDNSLSILRDYESTDKRVSIIEQKKSKGAGCARNEGMRHATGKYLSFLDADDYFDTSMLERLYDEAEMYNADIVICDAYRYNDVSGLITDIPRTLYPQYLPKKTAFSYKDIPDRIFSISAACAWNKLFKRDFINKNNLQFQEIFIVDDIYLVYMAMMRAKRIVAVDEKLVYYRHNNPSSQLGSRVHPDVMYKALYELKKQLQSDGIYEEIKRDFLNTTLGHLIRYLTGMTSWSLFSKLYNDTKGKHFRDFDIDKYDKDYFRSDYYNAYSLIMEKSPEEWVYERYRMLYKDSCLTHSVPHKLRYDNIPKDSKIILYGAGKVGKTYFTQLSNSCHCKVVLWVDKEWEHIGYPVVGISSISKTEYDLVVIAISDENTVEEIKNHLTCEGVSADKIVWNSIA